MKIHPLSGWRENFFETFDVTPGYLVAVFDSGRWEQKTIVQLKDRYNDKQ